MIRRHLYVSALALAAVLSGCGTANAPAIGYSPESLGLDPLDQVIPLSDQDHKALDNDFLTYLHGVQQVGDDGNWQDKPYDHYVKASGFQ